tara:strand:+ start:770 stop:967 length:198 start_codon:yes stop_codon:yes gene_type:complete
MLFAYYAQATNAQLFLRVSIELLLLLHSSPIPIICPHGTLFFVFPIIVAILAKLFPYDAANTTFR